MDINEMSREELIAEAMELIRCADAEQIAIALQAALNSKKQAES